MAARLPVVIVSGQLQQLQATDTLPLFGTAAQGEVPASGGGSVNVLFADGVWRPPGASSAGALALNQHVQGTAFVITAGYSATIERYLEISAGITVEIGADGDLGIR